MRVEFSEPTMATQKSLRISETVTKKGYVTRRLLTLPCIDPREYCISTKDFVVDSDGQLQGLNTGKYCP